MSKRGGTVFPGVSRRANELVVTFLAFNNGSTVEQISAATGISRSQVHLVIKYNSLVTHTGSKSRSYTYSVDSEKLAELTVLPVAVAHKAEYDKRAEEKLAEAHGSVEELVTSLRRMMEQASGRMDSLIKAQHMSEALQGGHIEDEQAALLQWADMLDKLERVKVAALIVSKFLDPYLDSPAARTPEWWTLFPKEANDERAEG